MKRLAILTAMLAAAAFASVPATAQSDEADAPLAEAAAPENLAAINRVKVDTLRQNADAIETDLAEVRAFMADLETKIAEADSSDLNAIEMMRMDLGAMSLEAGSMEAQITALRARADELEAEIPVEAQPAPEAEDVIVAEAPESATDSNEVSPAPRSTTDFLDIRQSELARVLVSEELSLDDVAIMGIVSGARKFCGMNWEPGFVEFILLANQNGYDLGEIADEHGLFMGGATRSLRESGYVCIEEDRVGLRTINPF